MSSFSVCGMLNLALFIVLLTLSPPRDSKRGDSCFNDFSCSRCSKVYKFGIVMISPPSYPKTAYSRIIKKPRTSIFGLWKSPGSVNTHIWGNLIDVTYFHILKKKLNVDFQPLNATFTHFTYRNLSHFDFILVTLQSYAGVFDITLNISVKWQTFII